MNAHDATRTVDVVLDAPASVSIYLHALEQAGRRVQAEAVVRAHEAAAGEASVLLSDTAGWSTMREDCAPVPHRYEQSALQIDLVHHRTPYHLAVHSHLLVEGRADVAELRRRFPTARSRYARGLGDALSSELGLQFALDAGALELEGVPAHLVDSFELPPCRLRACAAQVRGHSRCSVSG